MKKTTPKKHSNRFMKIKTIKKGTSQMQSSMKRNYKKKMVQNDIKLMYTANKQYSKLAFKTTV